MNSKFNIFIYFILLLLFACNNKSDIDYSQGIIHYQITYLDSERDNPIITLLPKTMDLKFKNSFISNELTGDMGLFAIRFIINGKDSTSTTLIRILDKKYEYTASLGTDIPGYEILNNLKLNYSGKDSLLNNFKVRAVKVQYTDKKGITQKQSLFYTKNLKIKFGNYFSPFKMIPGVLVRFKVKFNGINMRFEAKGVEYKDVKSSNFIIPEDYIAVDEKGIQGVMQKYLPQK